MAERQMPFDEQAETAVIGAVILDNGTIPALSAMVVPDDFYTPRNQILWRRILQIHAGGGALDTTVLVAVLRDAGDLERVGGVAALTGLTDSVCTSANADSYARIVRDMSTARRVIQVANCIAEIGYTGVSDVGGFVDNARLAIATACDSYASRRGAPQRLDDAMHQVWLDVTENRQPEGLIPTGIASLDNSCGGLWPGVLTVLAGRPGMGKSAFVLNIATNAALAGRRVLYVTLEDTR